MRDRSMVVTIAAILYFVTGLGYSSGAFPITSYLTRNRSLPTFAGIRYYEGGFFERQGVRWVIAASVVFVALGTGFVLTGVWLWNSMTIGGTAALVLFPVVIAVAFGSMAPIPLIIEPIKIALDLLSWGSLR